MKHILLLILLLCSLCPFGHAQGIEFSTYESETIQKTSYSVFEEDIPVFENRFSLSYDLAILDAGSFGYIFRLKDRKQEASNIYSFVFSYDNDERSYLKFNIEAKECKAVDTLCNKRLGSRRWIPVRIDFSLEQDSVHLIIDRNHYRIGNLGLPPKITPHLLFGSSKFSEEVPSFAIRNLRISGSGHEITFPLNESSGTRVHDNQGKMRGQTITPIWLINHSYHWELLHAQVSETTAGYNYDVETGNFIYFNPDSIYTLDTRQNSWIGRAHSPFPMSVHLGTNFFLPHTHSAYIYEVNKREDTCNICSLDLLTGEVCQIDTSYLSFQRHHHSSYLDTLTHKYYIFGGFGSRKYANTLEVYDLHRKCWQTIELKGDFVAPRFFSSMGAANRDELFLFGGTGNKSGDQSVGRLYYYDLYKINLKEATIQKIRDYLHTGQDFVPVRNLILSEDSTAFYTLCYPMQEASSHLQLYRFSLTDDSYEILGNQLPMESKAILSNANLYYNKFTQEFYCCTQEFDEHGGCSSITRFYSLSAPAIAKEALLIYSSEKSPSFYYVFVAILLLTAFFIVVLLWRRSKKKEQCGEAPMPLIDMSATRKKEKAVQENALYLFGELTLLDKKGKDITYLLSGKIKQLFLLVLLNSLEKEKGVTSTYIYGLLWPEKEVSSAKNLKGVTINRLRKILDDLEGIELVYANNHYFIQLLNSFYCDYREYLEQMQTIRHNDLPHSHVSQSLLQILSRGKFLKSLDDSILDSFKNEQETTLRELILIELNHLYAKADYEMSIQFSEILLKTDPFNDIALWYLLNSCHKLKKEEQAMKKYYLYIAEYTKSMGHSYPYSYPDIIHNDLRADLE